MRRTRISDDMNDYYQGFRDTWRRKAFKWIGVSIIIAMVLFYKIACQGCFYPR